MTLRNLCALLLLALAACGGDLSPQPAPSPGLPASATPPVQAPLTPPPAASATTTPPRTTPLTPYTGLVGTTDVSLLYPLAAAGESTDLVRPNEAGSHGTLLPESVVTTVLGAGVALDHGMPSGYDTLALVSLRLDPCSARGAPLGGCTTEVRAVFQAIYEQVADPQTGATGGMAATDGALHVIYDVPAAELEAMLCEILALKQANGNVALQELGPHPILKAQGLGGPFAQGLRAVIASHLGDERIARVTAFDHHDGGEVDAWRFTAFDRANGTLAAIAIPSTNGSLFEDVRGSAATTPVESSAAEVSPTRTETDAVFSLVGGGLPKPGTADAAALQPALDAALRVQNPTAHDVRTTSCTNCHLAEAAVRIGSGVYGLDTSKAFTDARSLAYVNDGPSATNLHAFGYLGRNVAVMQRTANESVLVASRMETALKTK